MRGGRALLIVVSIAAVAIGLILLFKYFTQSAQDQETASAGATSLFAASYPDISNVPQPLSQWRNRILIVNFWASWCQPCRDEMPDLSALQDRYRSQGVVVLGISSDDVAKMQEFSREVRVNYPLLAGGDSALDIAYAMGNTRRALPYTVILRRDGSVAATHLGRIVQQSLEAALTPLL